MEPNDKFKTRKIFSQLANINKFIIKQEANEDELEFNKNDQLISRSESEHRIFLIFFVVSLINLSILTIFTVVSYKTFDKELQIIPVEIPIQFKVPYLQTILKNGSVYLNQYKNQSFAPSEHKFDLPPNADYYFSFEYKEKMSYVYGYGLKNNFFHHFKTINGHNRQKKHHFNPEVNSYWDQGHPTWKSKTGFNSTVSQFGQYLLIFGGGKNKVGSGCNTSPPKCKLVGEVSSNPYENPDQCNCSRANNLFLWSTKKAVFIPFDVRFPSGFGFYSGCHVTLDAQEILMIGGHHMTWDEHQFENHDQLALPEEYFVRNPPNNQVVQLDVLKNKWYFLPNVPIDMNTNGLDVHYVCATSISKNYSRSVIVLANTFENDQAIFSKWFSYIPEEEIWTKHQFSTLIQFPSKPNWFLVPILGELFLFCHGNTMKFDSETKGWIKIDQMIDLPIVNIKFLYVAYHE